MCTETTSDWKEQTPTSLQQKGVKDLSFRRVVAPHGVTVPVRQQQRAGVLLKQFLHRPKTLCSWQLWHQLPALQATTNQLGFNWLCYTQNYLCTIIMQGPYRHAHTHTHTHGCPHMSTLLTIYLTFSLNLRPFKNWKCNINRLQVGKKHKQPLYVPEFKQIYLPPPLPWIPCGSFTENSPSSSPPFPPTPPRKKRSLEKQQWTTNKHTQTFLLKNVQLNVTLSLTCCSVLRATTVMMRLNIDWLMTFTSDPSTFSRASVQFSSWMCIGVCG